MMFVQKIALRPHCTCIKKGYHDRVNHEHVEQFFFWGLIIVATILFGFVIQSLAMPIFSAVVLAILFHPLYSYIERQLKGYSSFASGLTILFIVIVVALPLYGLGTLLATEAV